MAVVGRQYHHGIIKPSHRFQSIHKEAEPAVTHGDFTTVVRPGAGEELRVQVRDIAVEGEHILPALLLQVHPTVVFGHQPGLVRVERFNREKEPVGILVLLQPQGRFFQYAWREVVLLMRTVADVGDASLDEPDIPLFLQFPGQPVVNLLLRQPRSRACHVDFLPSQERPLMEAPPEVLGRLEHVVHVRNEGSAIARRSQQLGKGRLLLGNRPPAGSTDEVTVQAKVPVVKGVHPAAGVQCAPCGKSGQCLRKCPGHHQRFLGEPVEVRRMYLSPWWGAVDTCAVFAPRIKYHQDNIHLSISFPAHGFSSYRNYKVA